MVDGQRSIVGAWQHDELDVDRYGIAIACYCLQQKWTTRRPCRYLHVSDAPYCNIRQAWYLSGVWNGTCSQSRPGEEVKITEDLARLIKPPNETVVASIKTLKGEFKSMPVSLQAQGVITYDTRNIYTIPARIGGRLDKVYLKYTFQPVHKGQKVAEIYSPELLNAQRELLYLLENDRGNKEIIESSKNKLYLLGATQNQVDEIIKRKEAPCKHSLFTALMMDI